MFCFYCSSLFIFWSGTNSLSKFIYSIGNETKFFDWVSFIYKKKIWAVYFMFYWTLPRFILPNWVIAISYSYSSTSSFSISLSSSYLNSSFSSESSTSISLLSYKLSLISSSSYSSYSYSFISITLYVKLLCSAKSSFSIEANKNSDGSPKFNDSLLEDELWRRFSFDFLSLSLLVGWLTFGTFYSSKFSSDQFSSFESLQIELAAYFLLSCLLMILPHFC